MTALDLAGVCAAMATMQRPQPPALRWASLPIVPSAVLKSAQFTFDGWLIQLMEAHTPV